MIPTQAFKYLPTEKTKPNFSLKAKTILINGANGVGKSTMLNRLDNHLVIDMQRSVGALESYVAHVTDWKTAVAVKDEVCKTKNDFEFVSIEMAGDLVKFAENYVCEKNKVSHISDLAFGKGYAELKELIYSFAMDFIKTDKTVIFVTHPKEKILKTKVTEFTVMQTALPAQIQDLLFGLADFNFYCYVSSDGKRLMRTKPHKNIEAKDRTGVLPEIMQMDLLEVKRLLEQKTNITKETK